jgi:hypothetical protein
MYFVFACIWAFGGALVEKDGINYRRNFDKWWKQTWTTVKFPGEAVCRLWVLSLTSCHVHRVISRLLVKSVNGVHDQAARTLHASCSRHQHLHTLTRRHRMPPPPPPRVTQARAACTTTLSTPRPPSSSPGWSW